MNEGALAVLDESATSDLWARAQNNLAIALQEQGKRTTGPEGSALLGQAVDS